MTSMLLVRYFLLSSLPFPTPAFLGGGEAQHLENWTGQAEASKKKKNLACIEYM